MRPIFWYLTTIFLIPLGIDKLYAWDAPFGSNLRVDLFAVAGVAISAAALIINYLEQIDRRMCSRLDEIAAPIRDIESFIAQELTRRHTEDKQAVTQRSNSR